MLTEALYVLKQNLNHDKAFYAQVIYSLTASTKYILLISEYLSDRIACDVKKNP